MEKPIVNPQIPYCDLIPGGLQNGKMLRIQGAVQQGADRFNVNLQAGPNTKPRDDTALHLSIRLKQGYIARNSYKSGNWGDEQGNGRLNIGPGQQFEMLILPDSQEFKIAINGEHFCEFPYRFSKDRITHIAIDGDVIITLISWEGTGPSAPPSSGGDEQRNTASTQQTTSPGFGPQGYGPPPSQGYGPPQGFGAVGSQGYGPAGPQGYGPPPPGINIQGTGMPIHHLPQTYIPPYPVNQFSSHSIASHHLNPPSSGFPHSPLGYAPAFPYTSGYPYPYKHKGKKMKKSKLKKAMKYGLPVAGVGLGTYALASGLRHRSCSSSSSSSSSSSD